MVLVSRAEFEELVSDALDTLPPDIAQIMDNVAVFVEDWPPPGRNLLGLYEGVPLTARGPSGYGFALPDRITIYRLPLQQTCFDVDQLRHQVQVTVAHEVAHHFGISDERLAELGYG